MPNKPGSVEDVIIMAPSYFLGAVPRRISINHASTKIENQ